jgi:hypothetical protein
VPAAGADCVAAVAGAALGAGTAALGAVSKGTAEALGVLGPLLGAGSGLARSR